MLHLTSSPSLPTPPCVLFPIYLLPLNQTTKIVSIPCILLAAHVLLLCVQEGGEMLELKPMGKADCLSRVPKALT